MEVSGHNFSSEEEVLMLQLYKLIKTNRNEITIPTFEMEWLCNKIMESWNLCMYFAFIRRKKENLLTLMFACLLIINLEITRIKNWYQVV